MKRQKKQIIVGLLLSIIIIGIMSPLISNVRAASYALGYVKDDGTRAGIASVYVTVYGRYVDSYGRLKSFSRSGYTNSYGRYLITLPSTTVYTNGLRASKTGYVTYDGSVVNPVYLSAKAISLRFTGKVLEKTEINNIKYVNSGTNTLTLDLLNDGQITGYSDVITEKIIYVRIYDKSNNLLRTVSCNQATGYYDTGSFGAPAGNIKVVITATPSDIKRYKTITYTEEFLSTKTTNKNFYLERDLGEVWAYGDDGSFDDIDYHKLKAYHPNSGAFWFDVMDTTIHTSCPSTIVYEPTTTKTTWSWLTTYFNCRGTQQNFIDKSLIREAKIQLFVQNRWTDDTDVIKMGRIDNQHSEGFTAGNFDWNIQASLGYSGLNNPIGGQLQLSGSYEEPDGVIPDSKSIEPKDRVREGDWTEIGWITMDYTNHKKYLQKSLHTHWQIGIDNENYLNLKNCGSNIRFKVVYGLKYNLAKRIYGRVVMAYLDMNKFLVMIANLD